MFNMTKMKYGTLQHCCGLSFPCFFFCFFLLLTPHFDWYLLQMSAAWLKCKVILFARLIPANDYQKLDKTKQSLTGILFSHWWVNREKKTWCSTVRLQIQLCWRIKAAFEPEYSPHEWVISISFQWNKDDWLEKMWKRRQREEMWGLTERWPQPKTPHDIQTGGWISYVNRWASLSCLHPPTPPAAHTAIHPLSLSLY